MITASFRISMPENNLHEAKEILESLNEPFQIEAGCISCRFFREIHNSRNLLWEEEWKSLAHLERHIRSKDFKKLLFVLDMSEISPEIRIKIRLHDGGMEYIKALLTDQDYTL